jgi:hypothetical protein
MDCVGLQCHRKKKRKKKVVVDPIVPQVMASGFVA